MPKKFGKAKKKFAKKKNPQFNLKQPTTATKQHALTDFMNWMGGLDVLRDEFCIELDDPYNQVVYFLGSHTHLLPYKPTALALWDEEYLMVEPQKQLMFLGGKGLEGENYEILLKEFNAKLPKPTEWEGMNVYAKMWAGYSYANKRCYVLLFAKMFKAAGLSRMVLKGEMDYLGMFKELDNFGGGDTWPNLTNW